MQHYVYVLNKDGQPLMPTTRYGKVRRMLKSGMATAVQTKPFTIRLNYEPDDDAVQPVRVAPDPGRTNIGLSAVREDGKCLFRAKCTTRNKEIPKLMGERKTHRQASRRGERQARKRLARRLGTTMKCLLKRRLPGYKDGYVTVKDIINTEARFNNRKRGAGWLTPTARQLLQTHEALIAEICKILPVSSFSSETNKFDFVKMENPKVKPWEYGLGPLHGHRTVTEAIRVAQDDTCLLCGKAPVEHGHHMVPKSKGGSDTIGNIAGLCLCCHDKIHHDDEALKKLSKKKKGFNKKYGALSVLNQIIKQFFDSMADRFDEVYAVTGKDTAAFRREHSLEKDHDIDAYAIAMVTLLDAKIDDDMPPCYDIRQYRRHDRANIKAQVFRSYYQVNENGEKTKVAQNRHKATVAKVAEDGKVTEKEQSFDSLEEWFNKTVKKKGLKEAERMRSQLKVKKSYRRYNNKDRYLPGSVFFYKDRRYVMQNQLTNGKYYRAVGYGERNFPAAECKIYRNRGLVFI